MRRSLAGLGLGLALALAAHPAAAQYSERRAAGPGEDGGAESGPDALNAMQEARWTLGPLKVEPSFSIGDLGYVGNVYDSSGEQAEDDVTAHAGAGLRAYLRLGQNFLLTGFSSLDYRWWQDQEALRQLNESVGVELFGLFNRLQFQLRAGRLENQRNLSSEVETPVNTEMERASLDLSIDLRGPLRLFAGLSTTETRFDASAASRRIENLEIAALDRTYDVVRAGAEAQIGDSVTIRAGFERSESAFAFDPEGRSFESSGPYLGIGYAGDKLAARLEATLSEVDFRAADSGAGRDQATGRADLSYELTEKLGATVYARQELNFSALDAAVVFEARRNGVGLTHQLSRRGRLQLYYEAGDDVFARAAGGSSQRIDDHTTLGGSFVFAVSQRVKVSISAYDTRRDSTDPLFDRDITTVTSRVQVGGNLLPW